MGKRLRGLFVAVAVLSGVLVVPVAGAAAAEQVEKNMYFPHGPVRVLDTRATGPVGPYATTRLRISGAHGMPSGVVAVAVNLTVTDATGAGFLTAWADGTERPGTSNVNFAPGRSVPGLAFVEVGASGDILLGNGSGASIAVIADVVGYFKPGPGLGYGGPVGPTRLVDTRNTGQRIPGGTALSVGVGQPGEQVVLNIKVTEPLAPGYVVVHAGGTARPGTSNLNYLPNQTVSNTVVAPVGADGTVRVFTTAHTHLIVDRTASFTPQATPGYRPVVPVRTHDSRVDPSGPIPPGGSSVVNTFSPEIPTEGEGAMTGTVNTITVVEPESGGHFVAESQWSPQPSGTSIDFSAAQTTSNLMTPGWNRRNHPPQLIFGPFLRSSWTTAPTHVVIDTVGYFAN
ncbi:hypothetical protein L6E12_25595 [Actinokineospora sp. PR83]|uniref:hypothetical protein n=1 Tax=Actinokineospora sp. PR83 TaxID=2884908 RepID=UPI001F2F3060|nr:hypothetical protein [Actinokineospora sp. PR83]MCG8919158.1 hypothetical protein [Actinokineospora sp. PR83]